MTALVRHVPCNAATNLFFAIVFALALWPAQRRAKGEIYGAEPGNWKNE